MLLIGATIAGREKEKSIQPPNPVARSKVTRESSSLKETTHAQRAGRAVDMFTNMLTK